MKELLFHTPWWLPTLIATIGVALFIAGNNRQQANIRNSGLGLFLVAVVLCVVSYVVDTDIEQVTDRTEALIGSVEDRDWTKFRSLLDTNTSGLIYHGRDDLTEGAKLAAEKFNVRKARVISRQITATGSLITVAVEAYSEQDMPPGPMRTGWQFDWQERGNEWLLSGIRLVTVNNQPMNGVESMLPVLPRKK